MELFLIGLVWFIGHGPIAGALTLAMFRTAMEHPARIRNRTEFRFAVLCLGAAVLSSVVIPLVVLAFTWPRLSREANVANQAWVLCVVATPSILTTLAILLGIDSVMPARLELASAKPPAESPSETQ